jgi:uncharacterized protein
MYTMVITFGVSDVSWTWDKAKAATNLKKHGVSFQLAQEVFSDPDHITLEDPCEDEERWRTIGQPFPDRPSLLFVVHTWDMDTHDGGRIISARKATPTERRQYEESKW